MNSGQEPKFSLRVYEWCPVCKTLIKDVRFKPHIIKHWVTSKRNEEFDDFIRRIFGSKVKIPFKLLEE